jgi:protein-disulfide isomerase
LISTQDHKCDNGLTEKNLALFKKNNFQGTPAIVFENGMTLKGFAENPRLEEMLAKK